MKEETKQNVQFITFMAIAIWITLPIMAWMANRSADLWIVVLQFVGRLWS